MRNDFIHPWELGCEGMRRMMDQMETIATDRVGSGGVEKVLGKIEGE